MGLGHFFPTFACLAEGGGLKLFCQCPNRTSTFQKGASLIASASISWTLGGESVTQSFRFLRFDNILGNWAYLGQILDIFWANLGHISGPSWACLRHKFWISWAYFEDWLSRL